MKRLSVERIKGPAGKGEVEGRRKKWDVRRIVLRSAIRVVNGIFNKNFNIYF